VNVVESLKPTKGITPLPPDVFNTDEYTPLTAALLLVKLKSENTVNAPQYTFVPDAPSYVLNTVTLDNEDIDVIALPSNIVMLNHICTGTSDVAFANTDDNENVLFTFEN
jgi:hypothetical protein